MSDISEKVKMRLCVIFVLVIVCLVIFGIQYELSQKNYESRFYGGWVCNYISSYDFESYSIVTDFLRNKSVFVEHTNPRYDRFEWVEWDCYEDDLWNEYYDVGIIEFDPWFTLPSENDDENQWGRAVSKVGCEFLDDDVGFVMILPDGDILSFLKVG